MGLLLVCISARIKIMNDICVTLTTFYQQFHANAPKFLGWTLANELWLLRDKSYSDYEDKEWDLMRAVQKSADDFMEKNPQAKVRWKVDVSENRVTLDTGEWMAHSIALGALRPEQECGYSDLDLNFETQQICGMQIEEFHRGTWAKDKIIELFKEENLEILDPLTFEAKSVRLPKVLFEMNKDLECSLRGGMIHPMAASLAQGVLSLEIEHNGETQTIALLRNIKQTNIPELIDLIKDDIKPHYKRLLDAIAVEQKHLKELPDGWPNDQVYALTQQWAERRFLGDNGLVGSDFFDGIWFNQSAPNEIIPKEKPPEAQQEVSVDLGNQSFAQLRAQRAKLKAAGAFGGSVSETFDLGSSEPNVKRANRI